MPELKTKNSNVLEKRIGSEVVSETPQVSIITPAYNVSGFIAETLDSVLSQTFKSYEIVLVNDGSPDTIELEKVLAPYFKNIVYIRQENGGTAAARNTAIKAARGEWVAFLDGDDIWFPKYLASQLHALKTKNCDLIYTNALLFGNVGNPKETYMHKSPSKGKVTPESLIEGSCNLLTSGTIARREKVLACGLFDEELPRIGMEDFDLWFRLAKSGARMDYQRTVLLKYRVRPNSLSGSNVQRAERSIRALEIIESKHDLNELEKRALAARMEEAFAELELEKGKFNLAQENFDAAGEHFRQANEYYRRLKLGIVIRLLKTYPQLALKLFKKMRPADFVFAKSND